MDKNDRAFQFALGESFEVVFIVHLSAGNHHYSDVRSFRSEHIRHFCPSTSMNRLATRSSLGLILSMEFAMLMSLRSRDII